MYQAFLIKYSEIGIKGKNRYMFEDALCRNIAKALLKCEGDFSVTKEQGRIYVEVKGEYDYEEALDALTKVFGIAAICPVVLVEDKSWENVCQKTCEFIENQYPVRDFTFKVEAKRSDKSYPFKSPEIGREMGAVLLDQIGRAHV